ncbi:hypothetical protein FA13DRAFT_1760849 [Coprinellus micaceus]|uniref:T6SS Phospholipase effector Tle1-like catalytic domain-containing protein n=1 Tax=Coprinellus micaceus TaxID=71717 RepID=A0A4Y7U2I9_COPMI|nr:hypothetical protein FA13DRAFT_1760849 [Coprinellus micaceus]
MATGSRHGQEPTGVSMTETVVERNALPAFDSGVHGLEETERIKVPKVLVTSESELPAKNGGLQPGPCPPVIPPPQPDRARTIVLCFDGTGDQFDADNSNIVQLVTLLKKDDHSKQLVYYQAGIGTYTSPKIASPWMSAIRKKLDAMFGSSIHAHVMGGYEFLMQNYTLGDRICIFGFSRGAYTARSLAGMLHKIGLLPPDNFEQVPFAYKMYLRTDKIGWEQSNEFKKAFSIHVDIDFIGVWDTVDSVGIIPKRLPFSTSNTIVKTFRHAVALDERRAKFKANLWNRPTEAEKHLGLPEPHNTPTGLSLFSKDAAIASQDDLTTFYSKDMPKKKAKKGTVDSEASYGNGDGKSQKKALNFGIRTVASDEKLMNTFEREYSVQGEETDIEEVWFAGCHCDVGGGSVSNKTRHSLARISLRWMVREIFKAKTGILFLSDRLFEIGMDPATVYPEVKLPEAPALGDHKIRNHPTKEIPIRPHKHLSKKKQPALAAVSKLAAPGPRQFLGSETEEELLDALSPIYDQLTLKKSWWFLELIPLNMRYQGSDDNWVDEFGFNHAKPRYIPQQRRKGVNVHRSVQLRMQAEYEDERKRQEGKRYRPRAVLRVQPDWKV